MADLKNLDININLENSAFEEAGYEVARILRSLADKMENGLYEGSLRDINGNTVGQVTLD